MDIKIEKRNFENFDIASMKDKCNKALDALWEAPWLKSSISGSDKAAIEPILELAGTISSICEKVIIVADGKLARLAGAAASATTAGEANPDVVVFGDTLATEDYVELLTELEKKSFVLIVMTEGEESLQLSGAFATLKRLLISKYGQSAGDRIYAVAGEKSRLAETEAAENDYTLITYPENIPAAFGANTIATLLPMAIKGGDIEKFLEGFRKMLSSPAWDLDGADYAVARALYKEQGGSKENILIWQRSLCEFGRWAEDADDDFAKVMLEMPADEGFDRKGFSTMILTEKEDEDVMMPYFEGCNPDGSLNLLRKETAEKYFFENKGGQPGVLIKAEWLDMETLGQLFAFVELSNGITEFLLKN